MQALQEETIVIGGMTCDGCVRDVRRALGQIPGVQVERVEVGRATVAFDPALSSREEMGDAIRRAGPYRPRWA